METFKPEWKEWIDLNLELGNCKIIMFQKSLDAGYSYNLLKKTLGIDYKVNENNKKHTGKIALKNATKLNARNLDIYTIDNFLTSEECSTIIALINSSGLSKSSTYSVENTQDKKVSDYRTSQTCYFKGESFIVDIESRICKTLGINNRYSEQIQGQKYLVGQEFKRHTDYFDPIVLKENKTIIGQRTWTFMIYLNDVEEGGYTSFPYAYTSTKPKMGTAVIWNNLDDGKENIFSTHCGMPIIKGEKYILTKWFKTEEINYIENEICDHHFLSTFHPIGFEKISLRLPCIDAIKEWMQDKEFVRENVNKTSVESNMISKLLDINNAPMLSEFQKEFKNILTKWIDYKAELSHVSTYGIREYLRGSSLGNHYDKLNVISAIIHMGDISDKPWNLYIEDHSFRPHNITMEYGDVVLYESTTCLHGRLDPFEGDSHRNMYIHFKPEMW